MPRVMLTADESWDPSNINDDMDGDVVYPDKDDVVDDDMWAFIFKACKNIELWGAMNDQQEGEILSFVNAISKDHATTTKPDTDYSKYQPNFA